MFKCTCRLAESRNGIIRCLFDRSYKEHWDFLVACMGLNMSKFLDVHAVAMFAKFKFVNYCCITIMNY